MKRCRRCNETKPTASFHAKPNSRDGLQSHCKGCQNASNRCRREANPALFLEYSRRSEEARAARRRASRVEKLGTPERCEICGCKGELDWDHNHDTGEGRGWLCPSCNTSLGKFGDNPVLLEAAAAYLRKRGYALTKPRLS